MLFRFRAAVCLALCLCVSPAIAISASATPAQQPCQHQDAPPPAIDASEAPQPGQPVPVALPQPRSAVGGDRMGECELVLPPGAAQPPANQFESWVLVDLDTGAVLAARDPHARQRPASLIKVLLALVALRDLKMDTTVTGTQDDANQEGTRVGIGPGGQYSNDQLLHALLMHSGNDAAHAFATQLGGMQAAVDKMNALAKDLGALDTRTATPSGLDGPGMSSSAYDLAVFFRAGMKNPRFAAAVSTKQMDFPGYQDKPGFVVANDNPLLYNYGGDLGGKTGYTDDAEHTYINAAQRGNARIVFVGMRGCMSPVTQMYTQSAPMMDYGFSLAGAKEAQVGQLVDQGAAALSPSPTPTTVPSQSPAAAAKNDPTDSGTGSFPALAVGIILAAVAAVLVIGYRRRRQG